MIPAVGTVGGAGILLAMLSLAAAGAQAQSSFSKPLTLPQAQGDTADEKGRALSGGVLSGASVPEAGSFHEATVNARLQAGAPQELSAAETARQLANPNSPLASLTLKSQMRWYGGDLPGADDQLIIQQLVALR
ncbi:MAG: hypothetical protein H6827_00230 [Planctomycetes bacterium]|nr:hypothetical protein [Planctomycetota bacterium]